MKPLLDLSVGLDRTQSPHQYLLKSKPQISTGNLLADDSQIIHYYGNDHFRNILCSLF